MPYLKVKYGNSVLTPSDKTFGSEPFSIMMQPNLFS